MEISFRVGLGSDSHRLVLDRPLILGGVTLPHTHGLMGHSDADVVLHAVTDGLLGAIGWGDIGDRYPDTDPQWKDANSDQFLIETMQQLREQGWQPYNLDIIIHAQAPKLGPAKQIIRENVARLVGLPIDHVNIKAKTGEHVGHIGRCEAIACQVVVLIQQVDVSEP